jgi:NAD-dependent deacetylase
MDFPVPLIAALRAARRVVILTGAGVSAESGLATFRDKQAGLWERFDPAQLATREAFEQDPELVWGWYEWRRMQVMRALPNAGHVAIKELAERVPSFKLVTQNVDDLHERAGSDPVHHLHGSIARPYCMSCRHEHVLPAAIPDEPTNGRRLRPPQCLQCGGKVRPGVVWFGEMLPQQEWELAVHAASECDVFFCVGTSSRVYPAASLLPIAARAGAATIQVNPAGAADSQLCFDLKGPSGLLLPELVMGSWPDLVNHSR